MHESTSRIGGLYATGNITTSIMANNWRGLQFVLIHDHRLQSRSSRHAKLLLHRAPFLPRTDLTRVCSRTWRHRGLGERIGAVADKPREVSTVITGGGFSHAGETNAPIALAKYRLPDHAS